MENDVLRRGRAYVKAMFVEFLPGFLLLCKETVLWQQRQVVPIHVMMGRDDERMVQM